MNTNNTMTYPQVQAIEPTAAYKKATRGIKTGRVLLVSGIAIAAGLSNGLSALGAIPEHTIGTYGGLIALGIVVTLIGVIMAVVSGWETRTMDNPHLVERHSFSDRSTFDNDYYYSPAYSHLAANIHHHT